MADNKPRLVRNTLSAPCKICNGIHEYVSKSDGQGKKCGVPIGFSFEVAEKYARIVARGAEDVVPVPDGMTIVLDKSARKFKHNKSAPKLAHFSSVDRLA